MTDVCLLASRGIGVGACDFPCRFGAVSGKTRFAALNDDWALGCVCIRGDIGALQGAHIGATG